MSERALPDPQNKTANNLSEAEAEIIALNPALTEIFETVIYDEEDEKKVIYRDKYEIWPLLDIRMSQEDIDALAADWKPLRAFQGVGNLDKPLVAARLMMEQTHITVDATTERRNMMTWHEVVKRAGEGKKPTATQEWAHRPSRHEIIKVAQSDNGRQLIQRAVFQLEAEKSKGLSDMLDYLEAVEKRVEDRSASLNLVRLFNAIDSKTGGRDPDMMVTKRILLVVLDQELNPALYED
jgi:hypothetical protein